MSSRRPNFLHIGPGKAGSTWLHEVLARHPQVYLSPAKDLYFFTRFYDRGADWYGHQFAAAPPHREVVGEFSPDYLGSPLAAERISATLGPQTRLMVTLRDPAERAFSAYLYARRHGLAGPDFRSTLLTDPLLLEEGRYGTLLRRYTRCFPRDSLLIALFDDLQSDAQGFVDTTTDWLAIDRHSIQPDLVEARLPASEARSVPAAALARRAADWVRARDGAALVGRVKRSPLVQRTLYRPLGTAAPHMDDSDRDYIRELLEPELTAIEEDFGIPLRRMWRWR